MGFFSLSILVFSLPGGLLGQRFGRRRVILTAIVLLALLYGCAFGLKTLEQARVLLVLAGMAWSTMVVNSLPMVVDCAPEGRIGTYTGLYYVASQSSAIIGPYAAGWMVQLLGNAYRAMFPYAALALTLAGIAMWGVRRGEARPAVP
jgi:maltose/moltooligosaccharide transporter